ncbi:MAG: hypothetical protein IPK26_31645 [Planctomycetes bacterium]|nr:hypothetical protein [Planctomycetota bacterium]
MSKPTLWLLRGLVLAWAGFWTWFAICDFVAEGTATEPIVGLAMLLIASATTIWRPRLGGWLLLAFGALTTWRFGNLQAFWIFCAPALVLGAFAVLGDRRAPTARPA